MIAQNHGDLFLTISHRDNHIYRGHIFPIDSSLNITINDTYDSLITNIFFDTSILHGNVTKLNNICFSYAWVKELRGVYQERVWVVVGLPWQWRH